MHAIRDFAEERFTRAQSRGWHRRATFWARVEFACLAIIRWLDPNW